MKYPCILMMVIVVVVYAEQIVKDCIVPDRRERIERIETAVSNLTERVTTVESNFKEANQ